MRLLSFPRLVLLSALMLLICASSAFAQGPTITNITLDNITGNLNADVMDPDGDAIVSCQFFYQDEDEPITMESLHATYANNPATTFEPTVSASDGVCKATLPSNTPRGKNGTISIQAVDTTNQVGSAGVVSFFPKLAPQVSSVNGSQGVLAAEVSDNDGTVVSCSFRVQAGTYDQTVTGSVSSGACMASIPANAPHRPLLVTVQVVDNDGLTAQNTGVVDNPNKVPTISDVRQDSQDTVSALVDDIDGQVSACIARFSNTDMMRSVVVTPIAGRCVFTIPTGMTGDIAVTITVFDNEMASSSATATINVIAKGAPPVIITPPVLDVGDTVTSCSNGKLVVTDLAQKGKFAVIKGYASKSKAGQTVQIKALFKSKKVVASTTVGDDGSWQAKAPLPAKKLIGTNKAMYQAALGKDKSIYLKLTRYLTITKLRSLPDGLIELRGKVAKKLPGEKVDVTISIDCKKPVVADKFIVQANGKFGGVFKFPTTAKVITVRLRTKAINESGQRFYTYTLVQPLQII